LSLVIIVVVSRMTEPPDEQKVVAYIWKPRALTDESAELAALPWYQNYRTLSALLLIVTGIFVYIWR